MPHIKCFAQLYFANMQNFWDRAVLIMVVFEIRNSAQTFGNEQYFNYFKAIVVES